MEHGMAIARIERWRPRASWVVPLGFGVVVLGTLIAVVVLSQHVGKSVSRPAAAPFVLPADTSGIVRLDVKQAGGGRLTLAAPPVKGQAAPPDHELTPGASTRIELLTPIGGVGEIKQGEWVSVIGIPNEVRNFSIHSVVVLPAGGQLGADHVMRSAGGFGGNEAAPGGKEQVIVGGPLERIDGLLLTLTYPAGPVQVQITDRSPLFRLEAGTVDQVREGDSVAAKGLTASDAPTAILVQHPGK
jgi:hypothetical protein